MKTASKIYTALIMIFLFAPIAILLVFVYCMIEPNLIEIGFNPFVLCLSALVSPNAFKGRSTADAKSALLASYC